MLDHAGILERLQRGLGRAFADEPEILNVPFDSLAVKVDPHYYLADRNRLFRGLARISGMFPDSAAEALRRSGNLIQGPHGRTSLRIGVQSGNRSAETDAAFLLAVFVDGALRLYGGARGPLPAADLFIRAEDRPAVQRFFTGKTPPADAAFAAPAQQQGRRL
jgi:hypothetical protein